jgi:hypothetical protein
MRTDDRRSFEEDAVAVWWYREEVCLIVDFARDIEASFESERDGPSFFLSP